MCGHNCSVIERGDLLRLFLHREEFVECACGALAHNVCLFEEPFDDAARFSRVVDASTEFAVISEETLVADDDVCVHRGA